MHAMAESSTCSSPRTRPDVISLKEAIQTQQKLLQKLYSELEEEREASATAASEALSMILRVQEEKAAVTMEASQYKRMTEEKMHHVEKSLMLFKELMYQKEMHIASLECQVQSYRYKMLSMGCGDSFNGEMGGYGENQFSQRNGAQIGNSGGVRRNNSLPAVQFNEVFPNKATVEIEGSVFPLEEVYPYRIEREPSHEFDYHNEDIKSYWEQIKQLDEHVEELSRGSDFDHRVVVDPDISSSYRVLRSTVEISSEGLETGSRTCSIPSEGNTDSFYKPVIESLDSFHFDREGRYSCTSFQAEEHTNRLETEAEATRNASDSIGVQDIFEVPQNYETRRISGSHKREENNFLLKREERLVKPDSTTSHGTSECHSKDEAAELVHLHSNPKNKLPIPPSDDQSRTDIEQLSKRLGQLEGERKVLIHKDVSDRWEEEMKLLKEIHEKLENVQAELKISKAKERPLDDSSVVSIMEEMWMFSL